MGKRKLFRRKSSNSDSEELSRKQTRIHSDLDTSTSEIISRANNVLYNSETHDLNETANDNADKMSASSQGNSGINELKDEMRQILVAVKEIKTGQDSMRKSFDSKLDKMRNEFMATLDGKIKTLRDELAMDLSKESGRIDQLERSIQTIQARLESVEENRDSNKQEGASGSSQENLNIAEVCITASNVPFDEGENLLEKAAGIIRALGDNVSSNVVITGAKRLRSRYQGKQGLVKISFQNTEQKINVLRNKHVLKDSGTYKRVILKSDKTHAERLIELNARTLLRQLPDGNNFRVDANGRIRERQAAQQEAQ